MIWMVLMVNVLQAEMGPLSRQKEGWWGGDGSQESSLSSTSDELQQEQSMSPCLVTAVSLSDTQM